MNEIESDKNFRGVSTMIEYTKGKNIIRFELDNVHTSYPEAAKEVAEHLISNGIACVIKSISSEDSLPILTVENEDYDLQIKRSFPLSFVQIILLKKVHKK